jgi:hypothetical protein
MTGTFISTTQEMTTSNMQQAYILNLIQNKTQLNRFRKIFSVYICQNIGNTLILT